MILHLEGFVKKLAMVGDNCGHRIGGDAGATSGRENGSIERTHRLLTWTRIMPLLGPSVICWISLKEEPWENGKLSVRGSSFGETFTSVSFWEAG